MFYQNRQDYLFVKMTYNNSFLAHIHCQAEIFYVLDGAVEVTIANQTQLLKKGMLSIAFPNVVHKTYTPEHSSAIFRASPWVLDALLLMAEVLAAISSKAAESCSARPDRSRTLPLEVLVRWRTSPTTPLIRSELSWRVPMVSRMGVSTYLRMIRKAAATRKIPTTRVKALVTREMM